MRRKNMQNAEPKYTQITALPKSLTRFYLKYVFRGHWPMIIAWILLIAYMRMNMVLFPLTQKWFVAMFERPLTGVEQFMLENLPTVLLIVGIEMSFSLCGTVRDMLSTRRNAIMEKQISETLNDYVQHQSMQYWTEHKSGNVNSQIGFVSRGLDVMGELIHIIMLIVTMGINVYLMTQVNVWITIIFAFMFVSRLAYTLIMMKPVKRAAKAASESASTLNGHVVDSLSNSYIVRLFAGAKFEHKYLDKHRQDRMKNRIRARHMQILMWSPFSFIWDIGYGIVLATCLYLFATGHILLSIAVFSVTVYEQVTAAIGNLVNIIPNLIENLSSAQKAYEELSKPISITDKPDAGELVVTHGKIEFKNVWFKYKRKWILRDFNLTIKSGERVGLVGASGAGKTTLVNLLMRFWDVSRGQILIDGVDIRDVTQDSLHRAIGFIPQEPTLFDRSLRDNICYGKADATDAQMRHAAKRAAADAFIMATDKKYDSLVGERGIKLSGGQKQRVAIARAFLKDAPILVLDEATSALDSETEIAIQTAFEDLASGRTTVAIAHRLSTLRNMDKIIVMRDGQIIESGSHNSLVRRKNGEYAHLWRMQSDGFINDEK